MYFLATALTSFETGDWPGWLSAIYVGMNALLGLASLCLAMVFTRLATEVDVWTKMTWRLLILFTVSSYGFFATELIWLLQYYEYHVPMAVVVIAATLTVGTFVPAAILTTISGVPYLLAIIRNTRLNLDVRVDARLLREFAEKEAGIKSPVRTNTGTIGGDVISEMARTKIAVNRLSIRVSDNEAVDVEIVKEDGKDDVDRGA